MKHSFFYNLGGRQAAAPNFPNNALHIMPIKDKII